MALGGAGGPLQLAAPNSTSSTPTPGGMDAVDQASVPALYKRTAAVVASKLDRATDWSQLGGPDHAILSQELSVPDNVGAWHYVGFAQSALSSDEVRRYDPRGPPALI